MVHEVVKEALDVDVPGHHDLLFTSSSTARKADASDDGTSCRHPTQRGACRSAGTVDAETFRSPRNTSAMGGSKTPSAPSARACVALSRDADTVAVVLKSVCAVVEEFIRWAGLPLGIHSPAHDRSIGSQAAGMAVTGDDIDE